MNEAFTNTLLRQFQSERKPLLVHKCFDMDKEAIHIHDEGNNCDNT